VSSGVVPTGTGDGLVPVTAAGLTVTGDLLGAVVEVAPDGILVIDGEGRIVLANRRMRELSGYDPRDLVGQRVEMLIPERFRPGHAGHRKGYAADPHTRSMGAGLELYAVRSDGTEYPVEIGLSPVETDTGRLTVAILRDVTDRRIAEREVETARAALSMAEEHERIGRDLHDTVIQRLFATGMTLQAAVATNPAPATADRLNTAIDEIDATIREIRTAIFGLQTRTVATGTRDQVLELAADARRSLGFAPRVAFEGPVETLVSPTVRDALLPSLREALSNVARHAGASAVDVELRAGDDVVLRVVDDGVGIDPGAPPGHGLRNLRQRAAKLGGDCTLAPNPVGGTVIEWRVPAG
jgi:two-component system, NarL family, sensor histidine kinase DevS